MYILWSSYRTTMYFSVNYCDVKPVGVHLLMTVRYLRSGYWSTRFWYRLDLTNSSFYYWT